MDPRVRRTIDTMERLLHSRLSLTELARAVNISPSYLTKLFEASTGTTPGRYLHQRRLARARELLERTTMSLEEVRGLVGLAGHRYFARDFYDAHGYDPETFQRLREPSSLIID